MAYPQIPVQINGDYHDIVSTECDNTIEEATKNFEKLVNRLQAINKWYSYSEKVKAKFSLIDFNTNEITDNLSIGNLIRIDIPGPGNPSGDGFDWTKIIDLQNGLDDKECPFYAVTIKPCVAPESKIDTVAHFYTDDSTNTFVVRRIGTCIYAEVHGRNQIENTSEVPIIDSVRNKAITIGSKFGLGSLNWTGFVSALLKPFKEE